MPITGTVTLDSLEGHLQITLFIEGDRLFRVDIASSRPQLAQRLLAGRTARAAAEMVGNLYVLCGRAQRLAAETAAEAAVGEAVPAARLRRRETLILAELAREHVWQLLSPMTEPNTTSIDPAPVRRILQAGEDAALLADALTRVLTEHLLGEPPAIWLARDLEAIRRWCTEMTTPPALRLAQCLGDPDPAISHIPLLPTLSRWQTDMLRELANNALQEPGLCARPLWRGRPAETGALARLWGEGGPVVPAWLGTMGRSSAARLLARLAELARLPSRLLGDGPAVLRAWSLEDDLGVAGVETARGLLLHIVRLVAGRVADYRILAPTEWNFHPLGPLAASLAAMPADAGLAQRARRVVASLDPCVACQVEIRRA